MKTPLGAVKPHSNGASQGLRKTSGLHLQYLKGLGIFFPEIKIFSLFKKRI